MPKPKLTDIDGIGPALAELLKAAGIRSVKALSKAKKKHIEAIEGLGPETAPAVKAEAKALRKARKKSKKKGKKKGKKK